MKLSTFSSGVLSINRFGLCVSWLFFFRLVSSPNLLQALVNVSSIVIVWSSVGENAHTFALEAVVSCQNNNAYKTFDANTLCLPNAD